MKVSTTLEKIQYNQEEEQKRKLSKEEEKRTKKEYLETIEQLIEEKIYILYNNSANYEITEEYILLYSDDIISDVINEVREEAERQTKTIEDYNIKDANNWESIEKKIYLWDNYYIEKDVHDLYFKICDRINKEYKRKKAIQEKRNILLLKNNFRSVFDSYGYINAIKFFENEEIKKTICYELAKNKVEYDYYIQNYYSTLNVIKKEFKKEKEEEQPRRTTQTSNTRTQKENIILRHPVATLGGFAIAGVVKGFKNAIK